MMVAVVSRSQPSQATLVTVVVEELAAFGLVVREKETETTHVRSSSMEVDMAGVDAAGRR